MYDCMLQTEAKVMDCSSKNVLHKTVFGFSYRNLLQNSIPRYLGVRVISSPLCHFPIHDHLCEISDSSSPFDD